MFQKPILKYCLLALGLFLATGQAHARIKYGLWEMTVKVQMDGMPVETPRETFQKCIHRKDLTPGDNKDKDGCKKDKIKRKGDTVTWTVNCEKDNLNMVGDGTVTYNKNTMTGQAQFTASGKGMATLKMKLQYSGKYLGRCKK